MSSQQPFLLRHRAAIIVVTTTAATLAILALAATQHEHRAQTPQLRRSNAVRRSRRNEINVHTQKPTPECPLGTISIISNVREPWTIVIRDGCLPSRVALSELYHVSPERAAQSYELMVTVTVKSILALCEDDDFEALLGDEVLWAWMYQLRYDLQELGHEEASDRHATFLAMYLHADDPALVAQTILLSEQDENQDSEEQATTSADQLKGVLYYIAEEQAKRKAYQHRGIRCEECGESPIRSIRWHCLNCADFDLCSTCKALTAHQKNHIFAEIKIPVPVLAQPIGSLPLWYPGNDHAIGRKLAAFDRRRLAQLHEYDEVEIDALADQFVCLTDQPRDGDPLDSCISQFAFTKALSHERYRNQWHSNMIVERMFAFYDTQAEGKIGFDQFVSGVAYLQGKHRFASLDRALQGFDLEGDGLICRKYFIRLLRAKFNAHRLLVEEIAGFEEAEHSRQVLPLSGSQPIGTVFQGEIPDGGTRDRSGKVMDSHGDLVPADGRSIILGDVFLRATDSSRLSSSSESAVAESDKRGLSESERAILGLATQAGQERQHRHTNESLFWDILEESTNETLDMIYKPIEARVEKINATKDDRAKWHDEIQQIVRERDGFAKHLESGFSLDPLLATANQHHTDRKEAISDDEILSLEQSLREAMLPTDPTLLDQMEAELANQSLETLLHSSGYALLREDEAIVEVPGPDPTMPQNRPNATSNVLLPLRVPTRDRLELLADIELDARRIHVRDGQVYLDVKELETIARADQSGEVEGLMKSWLSWAAF